MGNCISGSLPVDFECETEEVDKTPYTLSFHPNLTKNTLSDFRVDRRTGERAWWIRAAGEAHADVSPTISGRTLQLCGRLGSDVWSSRLMRSKDSIYLYVSLMSSGKEALGEQFYRWRDGDWDLRNEKIGHFAYGVAPALVGNKFLFPLLFQDNSFVDKNGSIGFKCVSADWSSFDRLYVAVSFLKFPANHAEILGYHAGIILMRFGGNEGYFLVDVEKKSCAQLLYRRRRVVSDSNYVFSLDNKKVVVHSKIGYILVDLEKSESYRIGTVMADAKIYWFLDNNCLYAFTMKDGFDRVWKFRPVVGT